MPIVLLADHDAELRDRLSMYLTENGFEVESASDGVDCLTKLRELSPAVLVLDLELRWGGSDGVLAWLREKHLTPVPSVVLTAKAGYPLDVRDVFEPPVADYLSKPFTPEAMLESVSLATGFGSS